MQQTKAWYHTVPGLFSWPETLWPNTRAHEFLAKRSSHHRAPEKGKESVIAAPILCRNQANPQILLHI